MAHAETSSTGVVGIVAIMLMVLIALFIAWRAGVFGGRDAPVDVDVIEQPVRG
jgi:hypothetical protein